MRGPRILLADNDESFLETCAEYIRLAGYEVETAHGPEEARRKIEEGYAHIAVLDLRLTRDDDEKDLSGLTLAKETSPSVPKIMLTKFQTWESVREALGTVAGDVPPAVYFVAKQEGLESLLRHVEQALTKYVRINWELEIEWRAGDRLSLVRLMEPELDGELMLRRGEELENLFRTHFRDKKHIIVSRSLWQRGGCAALVIFSFGDVTTSDAHVVICGRRAEIEEAAQRYSQFGPHAPGQNSTVFDGTGSTQHYAITSYALAGADLEQASSFRETYRTAPERAFGVALTGLFEQTLGAWHQGKRTVNETATLGEAYYRHLDLGGGRRRKALGERVSFLLRQIPTLGLEVNRTGGQLSFRFGSQEFRYPEPLAALDLGSEFGPPTLLMKTPGLLTGENVLVAPDGRTWLTDFSQAGLAPVHWNYITIEAAIRFDWAEVNNLQWLHGMEQQLIGSDFVKLYVADIEPPLRKTARAVASVRKLAVRTVNKNYAAYHFGILLQALSRLLTFSPGTPLTTSELVRLSHLLLSASMICDRLANGVTRASGASAGNHPGISVDTCKGEVWINGTRVPLRGQSYELLLDLYTHANELRSRRALIEHLFAEEYDEHNESQVSRLNTAVRRLREKIEDDPDHPRFLLTEPHGGYRLILQPK